MAIRAVMQQIRGNSQMAAAIRRRLVQVLVTFLIEALVLLLTSGNWAWPMGWAFIAATLAVMAVSVLVVLPRHPEMIAERGRVRGDAKKWDRLLSLVALLGLLAIWIVAGLQEREAWPPDLGVLAPWVGLMFYVLGNALWSWAMASNAFFSGVVRIQVERGHTVATGGPYRYVRHPGYVAFVVMQVATALALESAWALVPAGVTTALLVLRTALEDSTLRAELPGYADYAQRTRYRLVPGIW